MDTFFYDENSRKSLRASHYRFSARGFFAALAAAPAALRFGCSSERLFIVFAGFFAAGFFAAGFFAAGFFAGFFVAGFFAGFFAAGAGFFTRAAFFAAASPRRAAGAARFCDLASSSPRAHRAHAHSNP